MTDVPNVPNAGPMKAAPSRASALVEYEAGRKDRAAPEDSRSPTPYQFEGNNISIIEIDGDPWFVASDVARELGHRDAPNLIRSLDDDEKATHCVSTLGGKQTISIISEPGMYRALVQRRANKRNDASFLVKIERFQRWVFHDILPSIRRTGAYTVPALATAPPALDLQAMLQDMTGLQTLVVGLLGRGAELEREVAEKALVIAQKTALVVAQDQAIVAHVSAIDCMRPMAEAGERFVNLRGAVCVKDACERIPTNMVSLKRRF